MKTKKWLLTIVVCAALCVWFAGCDTAASVDAGGDNARFIGTWEWNNGVTEDTAYYSAQEYVITDTGYVYTLTNVENLLTNGGNPLTTTVLKTSGTYTVKNDTIVFTPTSQTYTANPSCAYTDLLAVNYSKATNPAKTFSYIFDSENKLTLSNTTLSPTTFTRD